MVGFHRVPGLGALVKSAQSSCWRCNGLSKLYGIQAGCDGCDLRFQFQGCPNLTRIDYQPQAGVNLCTFIQRLIEKQIWFFMCLLHSFHDPNFPCGQRLGATMNSAIAMHLHAFTVYSVALNGRSSILHCHLVLLSFAPSRSRQPSKSKTA